MAARVSQLTVEALVQPTAQRARVSQLVVEALYDAALPPAGSGAQAQRWTGSAWTATTTKRWDGSAWVTATVKRWDGTGWV
jgi:hypothetical protein